MSSSGTVCMSAHIEMCKNVCVESGGVTGRSSSPQTRPDDEEGSTERRGVAVEQSPIWDMA